MQYLPLIGRILYALIFILSGLGHFTNLDTMSQYAESKGVPLPSVTVLVTGVMILLGGLSILLGYKTKIGAVLIFVFLLPTSFIMHSFWDIEDPIAAQTQMIMFMKNISMAGAALLIFYFGVKPNAEPMSGEV